MKRKAALFLLAVMLSVSLGAIVVTSLAMYRLLSERYTEEIRKIEASLSDRFAVFETMLDDEHDRITAHMEKVLPSIAQELEASGRPPSALSSEEMTALAKRHGVQHVYFINRDHVVFQTNYPPDMNLVFPKGRFTEFLDSVFGANRVMNDGIDLSQVTGTLKTYSYLGPRDKDYIIEISTDVRGNLDSTGYGWMAKYFFDELLTDPVRSNPSVKELNIYLINQAGTWSLIHPGQKLDPALAERIVKNRREEISSGDGRYLTIYSAEPTASATKPDLPVTAKHVIRKITYDARAGARGGVPGPAELAAGPGYPDADRVLDRLPAAAEAAPRAALQPARRGRRDRRGRSQPDDRQHRPARRDRPAGAQLRVDARCGAQDHHRSQGDQPLDRALCATGLPGDRRQAVDRRCRAGRQQAQDHDDPVLRHPELHDLVGRHDA